MALSFTPEQLCNFMSPREGLYTGGQPCEQALETLANNDFTTIINLRPDSEMQGIKEDCCVSEQNMRYCQIPVDGPDDVTFENADRLYAILQSAKGRVLVHCASGNRAGALLALIASKHLGMSCEEAVQYGIKGGLTKLEPKIREMLK